MRINKPTEFITRVRTFDGGYTDFLNIRGWLESSPKFKKIETVAELKSAMKNDSYFTRRHFDKLDDAHAFYFANKHLFV